LRKLAIRPLRPNPRILRPKKRTPNQPLRRALSKEDWANTAKEAREPLGKLKTRKHKFSQYKENLPGAPPGEYVLLQYESSFEGLEKASEIFTLLLEKDGKWRVVGYFVR
jgi:hypothetical protein